MRMKNENEIDTDANAAGAAAAAASSVASDATTAQAVVKTYVRAVPRIGGRKRSGPVLISDPDRSWH